ncbi:hypothetical protein Efla_004616 [Eimeria flavescens]
MARHVKRKLAGLLDGWRRAKSFRLFAEPVDVELMECPTYYYVIKQPMDLQTMEAKLERDDYGSEEAFISDLLLIFRNCRIFNDESTPAGQFVLALCGEAEARSYEDLKKLYKDTKLWAAVEQHFSHGKQKGGARGKGSAGASRRTASAGGLHPQPSAAAAEEGPPAVAPAPAAAAAGAAAFPEELQQPHAAYTAAASEGVLLPEATPGGHPGGPSPHSSVFGGVSPAFSAGAATSTSSNKPAAATAAATADRMDGGPLAYEGPRELPLQRSPKATAASNPTGGEPFRDAAAAQAAVLPRLPFACAVLGLHALLHFPGAADADHGLGGKSWYLYCRDNILRPIKGDRYAYLFLTPVLESPELPAAVKKSYQSVIERPMDYGTIWTKLTARDYRHPLEFFEDMFLVYSNCMEFNPPNDQQCGWLHRVAEKSRDKFVERWWKRWVVRIWRAFAQHQTAAAAAPPPALRHAAAAAAAAAVEADPSVAAGLALARAELIEGRHQQHLPLPGDASYYQQLLQQQPQQQQQQQHEASRTPRSERTPTAAAAQDSKYRALVVDLLGEDALDEGSNSSVDRAAATQETLQQQLQQLQQQQQQFKQEQLQLQQQRLEMEGQQQALALSPAASGESLAAAATDAAAGVSAAGSAEQQPQQQPAGAAAADLTSRLNHPPPVRPFALSTAEGEAAAAAAAAAADSSTEGKRHKSKKHRHHKSATWQQQQQSPPRPSFQTAAEEGRETAATALAAEAEDLSPAAAAAAAATLAAAACGPPGQQQAVLPAAAHALQTAGSAASIKAEPAAAAADAAAADAAGDPSGGSAAAAALADSPRLCDIIEAPPAELLGVMGVKSLPVSSPSRAALASADAAAAAAAAPSLLTPVASPVASPRATLTGVAVGGSLDGAAAAGTAAAAAEATAAGPAAAGGLGAARELQPALPEGSLLDGFEGSEAGPVHQQQQRQQQLLLPFGPKLRVVLESSRKTCLSARVLLLPWKGRGQGPLPDPLSHRRHGAPATVAAVGDAADAGGQAAAAETAAAAAAEGSVKRESSTADENEDAAAAEAPRARAAKAASSEGSSGSTSSSSSSSTCSIGGSGARTTLSVSIRSSSSRSSGSGSSKRSIPAGVFQLDEDSESVPLGDTLLQQQTMETDAAELGASSRSGDTAAAAATTTAAAASAVPAAAAAAAHAAATPAAAAGQVLQLLSPVGWQAAETDTTAIRTSLRLWGFSTQALSRCCMRCPARMSSSSSNSSGRGEVELWVQQRTLRLQPSGPLSGLLCGPSHAGSCPVSVSLLRCVSLGSGAAAAAVPLLLHLKLQQADAAAAALAAGGSYLLPQSVQLRAAAAAAAAAEPAAAAAAPVAAAAAAAAEPPPLEAAAPRADVSASVSPRAALTVERDAVVCCCCCCSKQQQQQEEEEGQDTPGGPMETAGGAARCRLGEERRALRSFLRCLVEEGGSRQQDSWMHAAPRRSLSAAQSPLLRLLARAAAAPQPPAAAVAGAAGAADGCSSNPRDSLATGLRFFEQLNIWAAALPSEVLLPLQQQQRQRLLRLPAVDVLLVHSAPLALVALTAAAAAAPAAAPAAAADGQQQQQGPVVLEAARKKRALQCSSSSSSSSSSRCGGCCCCCFFRASAGPAAEPLQAALSLG